MKYSRVFIIAVVGFTLLFALNSHIREMRLEKSAVRLQLSADITQIRLQTALQTRVDTARYLKSFFQLHPDTTEQEFKEYCISLMKYNPSVRALQFADSSTQVTYVYPPKGNEITITEPMVLIEDPLRGKYIREAIEKKIMTIQPPFELRQGGMGIVARDPIFISDKLFGIAIAVLDVPVIIEEALAEMESQNLICSLTDSEGNTFYSNNKSGTSFEERYVYFSDAVWTMRMYCSGNKESFLIDSLIIFGLGGTALVFLLILLWFLINRTELLNRMVADKTDELNESRNFFRIIADFTADWEYWISESGEILYNSPSCKETTGYESDKIKTQESILSMIHPEDRETSCGCLNKNDKTEKPMKSSEY